MASAPCNAVRWRAPHVAVLFPSGADPLVAQALRDMGAVVLLGMGEVRAWCRKIGAVFVLWEGTPAARRKGAAAAVEDQAAVTCCRHSVCLLRRAGVNSHETCWCRCVP